jgi:hypothetical protein
LSPDERWISFLAIQRTDAADCIIYVMSAAGGEWIPMTEGKYYDDKPHWSHDGKTLYFMSPRGGFFDLWGIRFDPKEGKKMGEPFLVRAFDKPGQRVVKDALVLDWALGRERVVLPLAQVSGNIWMLENVDR